MSRLYLGLDSSTQSLSVLLIDMDLKRIVYQNSLSFTQALSHYQTINGVLPDSDPKLAHAPPLMWIEALDKLLEQMHTDGCALGKIIAVSGAAQQHGSVYLNATFDSLLNKLDPDIALFKQLGPGFSRASAPIWMDTSTGSQCAALSTAFGTAQQLNKATGSIAVERFSGAQIKKFADQQPELYVQTKHIMLVSSLMSSLFAGRPVGIDYTDASGMNLLDIGEKNWHPTALAVCGKALAQKLAQPIDPMLSLGNIADYFVQRYGFNSSCQVLPWCGDNPSSLIGLGLVKPGMTAISLGTSDTCFGLMQQLPEQMSPWAHTFIAPNKDYMLLLCFKNGSLAREAVRKQFNLSWPQFSAAIMSTQPGNQGAMMLPWFSSEIVPKVHKAGVFRFALAENDLPGNCRAVVEAQMLSMSKHSAQAGLQPTSIRATGGASQNSVMLHIMADVFGCPVDVISTPNSAALGAALRAAKLVEARSWSATVAAFTQVDKAASILPNQAAHQHYQQLRKIYAEREAEMSMTYNEY